LSRRRCEMAKEKLEETNLVQDRTHDLAIFQAMVENAVDGMVLSTLEGIITYANPADYVLFGYNLETREMVGLPLSRFFSESSLKVLVEEAIPQSLDGASWQGEVRGIRKDGTQFDLFTTVFAIRDERGDPIALTAVLRDLTERKQTEEALQQREAVLGSIALAAEKFLRSSDWEQDMQAVLAYLGKAIDVSRVLIWEGSTSEDGEYLISWRYEWLAPEAKLAPLQGQQNVPVFRRWRDLLPRGEIITGHVKDFSAKEQEFFVPRGIKSVLVVPIFVNGVWWGFMGFDQGGTEREWTEAEIDALKTAASILGGALERKRAEEALRESEENFRALADNANDGIMIAAGKGAHVYANRRMAEITGYSVPELLKTTMADLVHPDQLKEVRERFQRRLEGKPAPSQYEIVFVRKDGKSVPLEMTSAKTVWRGQPATIVVFRDITERKRAEAERERLLTALEHRSTQLQTAAEVSHATSSILEPDVLIQQVVDLVRERFDLYYAGLFLVDENGEWAVLRAGTGEAGQKMMEQGHKLEVGGTSMIGWCVANKQARIALDVGEEAVRFANPLLPETRSEMALPLVSRGQIIGAMTIQSTRSAAFSEEDITVLQTMADQLANAIENARLFEETLARTREMTALAEMGRKLASTLELDAALDSIMDACLELFQVQRSCFIMMDKDGYLRMRRHRGLSEEFVRSIVGRPGEGFFGKVYQSGEAILVRVKGETVAVMNLTSLREDRRFSEKDMERLSAFADQAAIAIENARLFEEAQERAEKLAALNAIASAISHSLELQDLLQEALSEVINVMGFEAGLVSLTDEMTSQLVLSVQSGLPGPLVSRFEEAGLGGTLCDFIFQTSEGLGFSDLRDGAPIDVSGLLSHGIRSYLGAPLIHKGRPLGTICIFGYSPRSLISADLSLMGAIGQQIGVAVHNARLFQETKASLEEITLLHRRYLQEAWGGFLEEETGRERAGYVYDRGTVSPASTVWRPEIGLAVQRGDTIALSDMADALQGTVEEVGAILQASPTQSALAVPLKVRGQVIGALDFYETDQARDWSAEDIAMVEAVANQVALSIENARAYEELQKTAEQLKEMDRLKTQFLANMSHELRTPLNSIIGFSRVILKGIDGPITEQQRADLTSIYTNGQHLLGMINDILDISKIEAGKMELIFEPVDVQQTISGVMSTAIALVKDKPIELKQEVASNLPIVRADGTRLRQVILNLLSNAAKFTEEGQITLRVWADEQQITISVKDAGIGIPLEHQATIFEEFHQVDASTTRRVGGTGLGLAISRHFVEMHGGRIWVESEPGVGSTFSFTLPITGPAPVAESELAALTIDPSRKLILVVEDDQGAIAIYERYLEKHGYQVVGLNQGEQAVRWALELSPHTIILDVVLSGKDGWMVLEELKSSRETRQIPVIICTIVDGEEARGLSLGAADYLVKPILEEDLLQSLQRLEERQRI
jgi:PAS domain S-box-containing protein